MKKILFSLLFAGVLRAQSFEVRHEHFRKFGAGTLQVTETGISFQEAGKRKEHSRTWKYTEIQQLSLSADSLRILTYEDRKWQFGRDLEYTFDHLPKDFSGQVYPLLRRHLDQRFVTAIPEPGIMPLWKVDAKLTHRTGGSQGTVVIGENWIVYQTKAPGQSRTWRYQDIDNLSSAGPFDLMIVTLEKSGRFHSGPRDFHFQLKEPLSEERFNDLWRRIHRIRSLPFFTQENIHEED